MARIGESYSAFGSAQSPVRAAKAEAALYVLDDTAQDLRTEAALRRRVQPDDAEGPEAQAAILLQAAAILRAIADLPADSPEGAPAGPKTHYCHQPGCDAIASSAFGFTDQTTRWACPAHAAEIEALWVDEHAARERKNAEALAPRTDMAGIGGRLL